MKDHAAKSVPDRILISMICQTIAKAENEDMQLTSREIHTYISHPENEWYFESPDLDRRDKPLWSGTYSYDNLPGVRTGISYCIRAGYVLKRGTDKPHNFILSDEGRLYAQDCFFKYNLKRKYFMQLAQEEVRRLLHTDEQVEALAEEKRIEKCKDCKINQPHRERLRARTNTVRPHRGKIGIQKKDGSIREVPVTDEGQIQELEDLKAAVVTRKDGSIDTENTIMTLQNENAEMRNVLAEAGIRYEKVNKQLQKEQGRKTVRTEREFIRTMDRMGLAHYYVENNMYLDAEFFEIWGGSLVVVEYKRLLEIDGILNVYYDLQSTKGEIMTRTDFLKRILEPDEIEGVGIYVLEIRENSVILDSENFKAPKTVKV